MMTKRKKLHNTAYENENIKWDEIIKKKLLACPMKMKMKCVYQNPKKIVEARCQSYEFCF